MRREWLKALIIATPFLSIIADISSWYLTKISPDFAWMVIGSGSFMGSSFGIMFGVSMWQMWISRSLPQRLRDGNNEVDEDAMRNNR